MNKKFINALLFSAALLSTGMVSSCKDYDDDINGLQEQIDAINQKAPGVTVEEMTSAVNSAISSLKTELQNAISAKADKEAVTALENKISELETALSNKADAAKVTELLEQIADLSEKVSDTDQSILDAKAELEDKIAELQEQIANADQSADVESLKEQLGGLVEQLNGINASIQANADKIGQMVLQLAQYDGILDKIAALEEADREFITSGDLEAYYTKEEIASLIDTKLTGYMTESEVIAYIKDVATADIMAKVDAIYAKQGCYDEAIQNLTAKFDNYVGKQDAEYQKIISDLKILMDYKTNTLESLVTTVTGEGGLEEKVNDILAVLGDIESLETTLSGLAADFTSFEANIKTTIESYLKESLATKDSELGKIQRQLNDLGIRIDGLESMIQSVVFAPQSINSNFVNFLSYEIETKDNKFITVAENKSVKVSFRISPASAAKDLVKNYNISFEGYKLTRSAQNYLIPQGEPEIDEATGIVTYTMATEVEAGSYAVCMHLTAKEDVEDNKDIYTDITSDYFIVNKNIGQQIISLSAESENSNNNVLLYNDVESKISYNPTIKLFGLYGINLPTEGLDLSKFKVVYELTGDKDAFVISENGELSLKEYNKPSYIGKKVQVTAKVLIDGVELNSSITNSISYTEVTVGEKTEEKAVAYEITEPIEWQANHQAIDLDLDKLYDETGITATQLSNGNFVSVNNEDGNVLVYNKSNKTLKLLLANYLKAGDYTVSGKFTVGNIAVNVNVKFAVSDDNIQLITNDLFWSKDNKVVFTPTYDDQTNPSTIEFGMDLSQLIVNVTEVEQVTGTNVVIEYSAIDSEGNEDNSGLTYTGTELTISTNQYKGQSITVKAYVEANGKAIESTLKTAQIEIPSVAGKWTAGSKSVTLNDKAASYDVVKGFVWADSRGKSMWAEGKVVIGDDKNGFATNVNALNMYGLTEPTLELEENDYLELDGNKVVFTEKGKSFKFQQAFEVTLTIKAASNWGEIENYEGNNTITLTIPAGL